MKIKILMRPLAILFFLCLAHNLSGDTTPRQIQRLSWEGDNYALRYEVVIEKLEENLNDNTEEEYHIVMQEFTFDSFFEASLPPGNYRFQIIPHDFRDMPSGEAVWRGFEVLPQIAAESAPQEPEPALEEPEPAPEVVKQKTEFDIFASIALMPFIPMYEGEEIVFENTPSFAGAAARFGILLRDEFFDFYPGTELAVSWYSAGEKQALTATINFLAQKRHINETTAFTFRIGPGLTILPVRLLHTDIGISFMWMLPNINHYRIFVETGLDYTHYFLDPAAGALRPWIGAGVRF